MKPLPEETSWPASLLLEAAPDLRQRPREFERVWRGFMTARATLGLVLMVLQAGIFVLAPQPSTTPLLICSAYFVAALAVRLATRPQQLKQRFDAQWLGTVGVDVLAFATLQVLQGGAINYTPLLALPVLIVSVLGSRMQALAAAAVVTLLLLAYATWLSLDASGDISAYFSQAALTGAGCFAISFIASQMARRLASMELRAQRNQLAATVQRQVNELVIESMADGILVVDEHGWVRSANPAAHLLLGTHDLLPGSGFDLHSHPGWQALLDIVCASFADQAARRSDIDIRHTGHGSRRLRVRTQLTASPEGDTLGLCVVFMQDQREIQARIRAEKLASMGRMSAAVAHEIRNPLAAITQANALLTEDLTDPGQQRLARMVQQNALRLENIVQDVLHLTHAPGSTRQDQAQTLDLTLATGRICRDWKNQNAAAETLQLDLSTKALPVWFDPEPLRRILINLLDNAYRYASRRAGCIQVSTNVSAPSASVCLRVWSDGAPLEPSVEQHLFEPFFSSESRSSGLGLYICRELCDSQGASISYERSERRISDQLVSGNEFSVMFRPPPAPSTTAHTPKPD
ncbi:ATP-binding protein [Rhodoferax sp.]|uniref:sensor histidine kinase n=1 Tax=Rhodoferax sp. TaxID=50421 RepID=UPI0026150477|nr:ATP-binding protein [Rhodoferax sp.]MDD2925802.1 ATP-binding protein [Rhodoferax sp.]